MFSLWLVIFSFEDFEVKNETASEQSGHHLDEAILHNGGFLKFMSTREPIIIIYLLFISNTNQYIFELCQ